MRKNITGSMAIQAEMVAAADKGAFLFSFVMANMVVHIHCGLCRACEMKCKSKIGKRKSCNLGKLNFELQWLIKAAIKTVALV